MTERRRFAAAHVMASPIVIAVVLAAVLLTGAGVARAADPAIPPPIPPSSNPSVPADPSLVPALVTAHGAEQVDRLVLVWRGAANDETDAVTVYRSDPSVVEELEWSMELSDPDAPITRVGSDLRAVLPHLGYGRFWWNVTRSGPDGSTAVSETRMVRVLPRPLEPRSARVAAHLRLGRTSRRPGTARLVVRSAPRATVDALVRQAGRVVKRWTFTADARARTVLRLALSCAAPGPYRLEAVMVDSHGTRLRRQTSWSITDRCRRMRAAERRRAEARRRAAERRREAERRRREAQRRREQAMAPPAPPPSGNPYAGLNCSEIGHDFYVTPGSDPEHDADNDGHACESYG
jgi:hypothetical protein